MTNLNADQENSENLTLPYYAVIFTSTLAVEDPAYLDTAEQMEILAAKQPGYLGIDTARTGADGITVSYWQTLENIKAWREQVEHQVAQQRGKEHWYRRYRLRVAKVERDYGHPNPQPNAK